MTITNAQPEKIGESRHYWSHKVGTFPGPVAVTRMAQLVDFDDRLYETARIVYRFMISWYHDEHGDALMSMRHVSNVMKRRAPEGAVMPSRSAVHRAIIALMETGWVVRTFKGRGKGKGASRYVPVFNVLELASNGRFPELSRHNGTVQPSHATGTVVSHATGTVEHQPSHLGGTKTRPPDSGTDPRTGERKNDPFTSLAAGLSATAASEGEESKFDELYKAYGYRRNRADAKAAYQAIDPDADLHADIVESAKAWRASWAAQNKPDAPRYTLAKWLERECYHEDPPTGYKVKESKKPKSENLLASAVSRPKQKLADKLVTIIGADTKVDGNEIELQLVLLDAADQHEDLCISVQSNNQAIQDEGQRRLSNLCKALGKDSINDSSELNWCKFILTGSGDFLPAPVNDNIATDLSSSA